jgi:hypothetical protein
VKRLSRLAPEEIVGAVMLVAVIGLLLTRPAAVTELFESPFATPVPGGGPAVDLVRPDTPTPVPTINMFPRPTPATPDQAAGWIVMLDSSTRLITPTQPLILRIDARCRETIMPPEPSPAPTALCVQIRTDP